MRFHIYSSYNKEEFNQQIFYINIIIFFGNLFNLIFKYINDIVFKILVLSSWYYDNNILIQYKYCYYI